MSIIFKRIHDVPEHYYELDISDTSYGEFEMYKNNDLKDAVVSGLMICLRKVWRHGSYRNELGDIYVSPLLFGSEYYPVIYNPDGEKGQVEKLIEEAYNTRIQKEYGDDAATNPILETWTNTVGKSEEQDQLNSLIDYHNVEDNGLVPQAEG